ncbi:DUF6446 family protein [Sulfitobacter sp. D35]|uniref:DUF6446 family protein n=1 Tax=Sulfitobacter sp. D35 TaxID=3083252 RepID=UPI00296F3586|nr:DUF6446 family protein [Sulfitobacter sp. D35]MDW4499871.1 DUF6446 family protein [Sulfitobacter sp. D35]
MNGRIVGLGVLAAAGVAGAALYYFQVYGFYEDVTDEAGTVQLVAKDTGATEAIETADFRAIDADSSPIRFRACFTTEAAPETLDARYERVEDAVPRNAPGWFDCFDAEAIAARLADGTARAYLGQKNVHYGADRIVVVTEDRQGFAWNELNNCGEKAYDGTVIGEDCPEHPATGTAVDEAEAGN